MSKVLSALTVLSVLVLLMVSGSTAMVRATDRPSEGAMISNGSQAEPASAAAAAAVFDSGELLPPEEWPEGDAALPYVMRWVEANGGTFTVGTTSVSNLSNEDKQSLRRLVVPDGYVHDGLDFSTVQAAPDRDSWDWRDHGAETVVESQSPCGSCWSFAASHAVAAAYKLGNGVELNISEQHIIDCNSHGYSCNSGGWMDAAYDLFMPPDYGFVEESCYPYIGGDAPCRESDCPSLGFIDGYTSVANNVSSIKAALATGPVAAAYTVGGSFDYYNGGCFDENHTNDVNHAMLIMGWDDAQCGGEGAWIVKNSWGTGWGMDGYIYIQYGTSRIGYGADLVHYTVPIPMPNLIHAGHLVDDVTGDGDGRLDPGETAAILVELENAGTLDATGVSATLSSATPGVTITDNSADWPDIPQDESRASQPPHFTVQLDSGVEQGTSLVFTLDIECNENNSTSGFTITAGDVVTLFFDDMEGGTNGWTHAQIATQDDWMHDAPRQNSYDPDDAYSGSRIWGNDLAPGGWNGDYKPDVHNYLRSPAIDCSQFDTIQLKFMRWLTVEDAVADQATVYVNGTQVWQNAEGADHIDTAWTEQAIDISTLAGMQSEVFIEFHLVSNSSVEMGGWNIDDFLVYAIDPTGGTERRVGIVSGPGPAPGNPPLVRVFDPEWTDSPLAEWSAYGVSQYGVNVACGDLDRDGHDSVITGAGPGAVFGPHVRAFDSAGAPISAVSFLAYGTNKYGVNVACGDLDGDQYDEIITGAGPGAVFGPHVRGWNVDGAGTAASIPTVSYFAYGTNKYGVNVSCGDIDGDGFDEIVTGAGPGSVFGPHVRGWNVDGIGPASPIPTVSYLAYGTHKYGVNVACGDIDGDGFDEIITGPGPGGMFGAHVRGWDCDGERAAPIPGVSFFAYQGTHFGVVVGAFDLDGDGKDEILTAPGPDPSQPAHLCAWSVSGGAVTLMETVDFDAYSDHTITHGGHIAAGWR